MALNPWLLRSEHGFSFIQGDLRTELCRADVRDRDRMRPDNLVRASELGGAGSQGGAPGARCSV